MNINFDVNAVIDQMASALGVATDVIAEMYPQLLQEFVYYEFFSAVGLVSTIIAITLSVINIVGAPFFLSDDYVPNWVKITSVITCISMGLISLISYGLQLFTAPNISLYMKLFGI